MGSRLPETAVAREARRWLEGRGLEVFAEVEFGEGRIDLVGRTSGLVVAVECKVSLGLPVLEQAARWREFASETWAAVPYYRARRSQFANEVCREMGLGLLWVHASGTERPAVVVVPALERNPKGAEKLHRALHPEQKGSEAGGNGGHSTAFRRTVAALQEVVAARPGLSLREAVSALPEHHYQNKASAVSSLGALLRRTGKARPRELSAIRIELGRLYPQEPDAF